MKIFISYSRHDESVVQALRTDLEDVKHDVWIDHALRGGEAWWTTILAEIRACTVFLFALSDASLQSKPCRSEAEYARALRIPILPVQLGDVSSFRTDWIFGLQSVDYRKPTHKSGIALISALHELSNARVSLPEPLPVAPAVPFEYLQRLGEVIRGSVDIGVDKQAAALFELRGALSEEAEPSVRDDIEDLLGALRSRRDVAYTIVQDIDRLLGSKDEPAAVPPIPEVPPAQPVQPTRQRPQRVAAASAGDPSVDMNRVAMLLLAQGDRQEAERWLRIGADSGQVEAMTNLGALLRDRRDFEEARHWLTLAADAGSLDAMANLAVLKSQQDEASNAAHWLAESADDRLAEALLKVVDLMLRDGEAAELEPWLQFVNPTDQRRVVVQLAEAFLRKGDKASAQRYLREASANGNPDAMRLLATTLDAGEEADALLRSAADQGDKRAMFLLSQSFSAQGATRLAERYLAEAAEAGDPEAMTVVGRLRLDRSGTAAAEPWFRRAAEADYVPAMESLADLLDRRGAKAEASRWRAKREEAERAQHV